MSRQQIQLPLVGIVLLCLFVGVYMFTNKRFAKSKRADKTVKHTVDTQPADTLKYWTADKMRNTKATNMPHITDASHGKQ
jgi:hypothetical protein